MTEYALIEPFDIDDDPSLTAPQREAFVLGAEWGLLRHELEIEPAAFVMSIHVANGVRAARMVSRRGRSCRVEVASTTWLRLYVGARDAN